MISARWSTARSAALAMRLAIACAPAAVVVVGVTVPGLAFADSGPSADDKRTAAREFREGKRAFDAGDFRHAAQSFESAYKHAPDPAPLWNAARAWYRANENARAANLYTKYLTVAPPNAPDRNTAQKALRELQPKLAKLEIHTTDVEDVRVDDEPVDGDTVFVNPGAHVLTGRAGGKPVRKEQTVEAGQVVSVALMPPAAERTPSTDEGPKPPPKTPGTDDGAKITTDSGGWSPVVVAFGGAVTAITAGLAIWSGIDTLHQRDTFDQTPTQDNLDSGRSKQTRTNVLIGVSAGVAVLTAVAAFTLVDWKGGSTEKGPTPGGDSNVSMKLGVGVGSVSLGGTF